MDAHSLAKATGHELWPGNTAPDPTLLQIAAALNRATTHTDAPRLRAADIGEANTLITSVLWTSAQHIGRAVRDHSFDIRLDRKNLNNQHTKIAGLAQDTARRFNAIEQLAASGLHNGPHREQNNDTAAQLRQAIATWDVEAHRTLLGNRSTAVLHVLAYQQAGAAKAFQLFIHDASKAAIIDATTGQRLTPVLTDSARSWAQLRDTVAGFSFGSTPVPTSLIHAATNLQERFQDAVRTTGPADHREILGALSGHLASAVTISATTLDLIAEGELRAPARAVNRALKRQKPSPHQPIVDPMAIHRGLSIRLPQEARSILAKPANQAFRNADEAVNRAAGLDTLYRAPADTPMSERPAPARQAPPPPMGERLQPDSHPSI